MLDGFVRIVFYAGVGLTLLGSLAWFVNSAYRELTGRGDLVIAPFKIAESGDAKDVARGEALARMLQVRLQQIERELDVSQTALIEGFNRNSLIPQVAGAAASVPQTSIAPTLFVAQGAALNTRLLDPTPIKIAVAGVDVGVILPWLQRWFASRRTLELTYYKKSKAVIISGSLGPLGLVGESLRLEVPFDEAGGPDLDQVASMTAMEIERRRLARGPSNRVEALSTAEFADLVSALDETARLNRQAALGRVAREQFAGLLTRVERLAGEVRDWHQLQLLAASLARSAGTPERSLPFLRLAKDSLELQAKDGTRKDKVELNTELAYVDHWLTAILPGVTEMAALENGGALRKIEADVQVATDALNRLFSLKLKPLKVKLLPEFEANAYSDDKVFYAPPAVAQLPEITAHNMTWQFLNHFVPVFSDASNTSESNAVLYSYSDVLPVVLRQLGLIESSDPKNWNVYAGAVAWLRAAQERRDFKLGDDRRPLRSLSSPGSAYTDPLLGSDSQVAHFKNLKPGTDTHAAAGIGSKAFYEAAQRLGTQRATEIWLSALPCLPKEKRFGYLQWAGCLLAAAPGADTGKLREALEVVGLGSASAQRSAPTPARASRRKPRGAAARSEPAASA